MLDEVAKAEGIIVSDVIKIRKTTNRLAEIVTGKEQREQPA